MSKPRYYVVTTTPETANFIFERWFYGPYTLKGVANGALNMARRNFMGAELLTHTEAKRRYGADFHLFLRHPQRLYARTHTAIVGAKEWTEAQWQRWLNQ